MPDDQITPGEIAYEEYLRACYGDDVKLSPVQSKEVRQAFFAGALWAAGAVTAIPNFGGSDADMENRLAALLKEITELARPE